MVLVLWTDTVHLDLDKLTSAGTPVVQSLQNTGNDNRHALLRDPDGNLVEIVAKVV